MPAHCFPNQIRARRLHLPKLRSRIQDRCDRGVQATCSVAKLAACVVTLCFPPARGASSTNTCLLEAVRRSGAEPNIMRRSAARRLPSWPVGRALCGLFSAATHNKHNHGWKKDPELHQLHGVLPRLTGRAQPPRQLRARGGCHPPSKRNKMKSTIRLTSPKRGRYSVAVIAPPRSRWPNRDQISQRSG